VLKPLKKATPLLNKTAIIAPGASHKAPVIYPRYVQFLALKTRGLSLVMSVKNSGTVPELVMSVKNSGTVPELVGETSAMHWAVGGGIER
jgi:hypothetical protein